jgi:hypothetical protein
VANDCLYSEVKDGGARGESPVGRLEVVSRVVESIRRWTSTKPWSPFPLCCSPTLHLPHMTPADEANQAATDKDDHRLGLLPSSSSGTRGRHPPFLGMRALFLHEQTTTEDTARHCEASPAACHAEPPRPPHAALPRLGRAARRPPPSPRLAAWRHPCAAACRRPSSTTS